MILLHHWNIEIKRKDLLNSETKVLFRLVYKFDLRLVSNIKELTSQDPLTQPFGAVKSTKKLIPR